MFPSTRPVWALPLLAVLVALDSPAAAVAKPKPGSVGADGCTDAQREAERAELLAPATSAKWTISLDCSHELDADDDVTKQVVFEGPKASNATLVCDETTIVATKMGGGKSTVEVRSAKRDDGGGRFSWLPPEHVTIRGCKIDGSVRVWGMGTNGEHPDVRESSRRAGHVERVRANAPRNIVFDDITVTASGRTPFYLAPGVHHVTLMNSEITGTSTSAGVYLDTESTANVLRDNYFHTTSRKDHTVYVQKREELAIDNSSHNRIFNNRFSTLEGGGIYLYRNCGEGGTVRHSTPSYNQIINNTFFYDKYTGGNPAVFVGSRSNDADELRFYCGDDRGYPWGSSADDHSFARHNAVIDNRIFKRSVADMIVEGDPTNRPNYIHGNTTVSSAPARPAGCVYWAGYKRYLRHGESIDVVLSGSTAKCADERIGCDNGTITRSAAGTCEVERRDFDCSVEGDNDGCSKTIACPAGRKIVGAVAACNLEHGTVSDAQLRAVPINTVAVVKASGDPGHGLCSLHSAKASTGQTKIEGIADRQGATIACREHDANGGDCQVRASLFCR